MIGNDGEVVIFINIYVKVFTSPDNSQSLALCLAGSRLSTCEGSAGICYVLSSLFVYSTQADWARVYNNFHFLFGITMKICLSGSGMQPSAHRTISMQFLAGSIVVVVHTQWHNLECSERRNSSCQEND